MRFCCIQTKKLLQDHRFAKVVFCGMLTRFDLICHEVDQAVLMFADRLYDC
jgi:hypothetical protein